jgi:hypothetical protein
MPSPREMLEGESLEQLADRMQFGAMEGVYRPAAAEMERRRAIWQHKATMAEQDAAIAAKSTAAYTKQTARYMLWSVVAIFVTSGLSALFSFLAWAYPRH